MGNALARGTDLGPPLLESMSAGEGPLLALPWLLYLKMTKVYFL